MKTDLFYYTDSIFINFLPSSNAGIDVWNEMAAQSDGTGKFPLVHADEIIYQLQKAGFIVKRGKNPIMTPAQKDALLAELFK